MKRYSFPLNRVLDWKTVVAQQEQTALEELERKRASIQSSLLSLDQSIRGLSEESRDSLSGHELAYSARARATLQRQKTATQKDQLSCEKQIDTQQQRFRNAETDRRLFDKLRARSHSQWTAELSRETEAEAADLYLGSLSRR